jgi:hypothetical protein
MGNLNHRKQIFSTWSINKFIFTAAGMTCNLWRDATPLALCFTSFQGSLAVLSWVVITILWLLRMKRICFLETSGVKHVMTPRHIHENVITEWSAVIGALSWTCEKEYVVIVSEVCRPINNKENSKTVRSKWTPCIFFFRCGRRKVFCLHMLAQKCLHKRS